MTLYYFNHSNGKLALDEEGTDLPDLTAVRNEAVRAMRELLMLGPSERVWQGEPWKVWATDKPNGGGATIVALELTVIKAE